MKKIYILYECDDWKSNDSKVMLFIGTSRKALIYKIKTELQNETMTYIGQNLDEDLKYMDIYEIDRYLQNGIIDIFENNTAVE